MLPCLWWGAPGYKCMCVVNNPTIYTKTTEPRNKRLYGSGRPWTSLPAQSGSFFFFLSRMSVKWLQNKLKWKENYYKEAITDGQRSSKGQSNGKWPQRSQREFRKTTEHHKSATIRQKMSTKRIKLPLNTFFCFQFGTSSVCAFWEGG